MGKGSNLIGFPMKYATATPQAAGMANKLNTALPMIAPVPMSLLVKNTPIAEENISGPEVPNGISIAPVMSGGK